MCWSFSARSSRFEARERCLQGGGCQICRCPYDSRVVRRRTTGRRLEQMIPDVSVSSASSFGMKCRGNPGYGTAPTRLLRPPWRAGPGPGVVFRSFDPPAVDLPPLVVPRKRSYPRLRGVARRPVGREGACVQLRSDARGRVFRVLDMRKEIFPGETSLEAILIRVEEL